VDKGIYVWRTSPGGAWELRCSTPDTNYDNFDGRFTDGTIVSGTVPVMLEDPGFVPGGPMVWRNDGGQSFTEVTAAVGLPAAMLNPRDISWVDFDNDGDLDLHVVDMGTSASPNAPDALFRNDGGQLTDVTEAEGIVGGTGGMGDGAVWGDTDGDGDLDVYIAQGAGPMSFAAYGPALFLQNTGARGHSIQLDLEGRRSNAAAVGARVTAVVGSMRVLRRVTANSWRGFQDPLRVHLGLGAAEKADSLIVEWPSGDVHAYTDVPAGIYPLDEETEGLGAPELGSLEAAPWRVVSVRPQPATGSQELLLSVERRTDLTVRVYDVAGRLVRSLHHGPLGVGTTAIPWNGRDDEGRPVAAGVYLLRVSGEDGRRAVARSIRLH
jgi:hypothetical protein